MPGPGVSPPKRALQLKLDSFFLRDSTEREGATLGRQSFNGSSKENSGVGVNLGAKKGLITTTGETTQDNEISKSPSVLAVPYSAQAHNNQHCIVEDYLHFPPDGKRLVLACKVTKDQLRELCWKNGVDCEELGVCCVKRLKIADGTAATVKYESPNWSQGKSKRKASRTQTSPLEEYEVDQVVKVRIRESKLECLIKWKGWDEKYNQWEPLHNLDCHVMLIDYLVENKYPDRILAGVLRHIMEVTLLDNPVLDLKIAYPLLERKFVLSEASQYTQKSLKAMRTDITNLRSSQLLSRIHEEFGGPCKFIRTMLERQDYLDELENWRESIKKTVREPAALFVENFVDNDPPPTNFQFMSDYTYAEGIMIERAELGCRCRDCYKDGCGGLHNERQKAYNERGVLTVACRRSNSGIIECNASCTCPASCFNRVTQRGRQVPVTIFKTDNGRGWGLRANAPIRAWSFVMEYLGEVITSEMAGQRTDDTYLFDIDFNTEREAKYTVDALQCGNCSHFINHSCNPNLVVIPVWVDNLDLLMPRLAFFSSRDIRKHEELTFDYRVNVTEAESLDLSRASMDDNPAAPGRLLFQCRCGAENCRGQFN
ncbi:histone-lysine N-methyltransferase SUV39H2-like isoform X1 [Varroa destructor]|uniref:Histone-lysine N-methyltransferase n=1 Tax=Varroa destructor TaxID=109461 RepID=A0A7M7JTN0_VARDE|nr:histone-lysine N-methyltransferase SUV39H2-like isoform X1 [Varroa destructor]